MTIKSFIAKKLDIFSLILLILSFVSAYYLQYYENLHPCKLCIVQRCLYYVLIFILILRVKNSSHKYQLLLPSILAIIIFFSGYQSLLEQGLVGDWFGCAIKTDNVMDLSSIINTHPQIDCSYVPLYILGLSAANHSFIISFSLFVLYLIQFFILKSKKYEKYEK